MSGIYIKGMEMPKSCYECRFAFDGMCIANRGRKDVGITNSCPLIEQKHGKWKTVPVPEIEKEANICPFCRWIVYAIEPLNFCPNCGARMDGDNGT